ncbi:hypothetical protein R1flu_018068 [Riccia fluitans]|uniref:Uncharacterized protein n=1 Tax=Riccia fluitans TaxID=41844 RepID=A0ABD1ZG30_9MARC
METCNETPLNIMDSEEAIGAASSILNPLLAGSSDLSQPFHVSAPQFHVQPFVAMIGNPHFAYQVNPNYTYGQMLVPMPSRPLAYRPGPYALQGFHIPSSLIPIPSPNFNFAGNPVHVVSAFGFADGENANIVVSNAAGRPGPASRPTNSGRGTDRPNGKDRGKKQNLLKQRTQASRPRPSVANASSARSPSIVGSDLPTPIENPETPGGNMDPAPTQPGLNTSEEDNEEDLGFGRAR